MDECDFRTTVLLKEYEELSEDRRRAVEIWIKGFVITAGIMSLAFGYVMTLSDFGTVLAFSVLAFAIGVVGFPIYTTKCWRHQEAITSRLGAIATNLKIVPPISVAYIFAAAITVALLIWTAWLAVAVMIMVRLASG